MISGFNTDIIHEGVTYHVQTEDKGSETPLILSLVYLGGTILASKRSPYEDLLTGSGLDEQVLEARLQRQHQLMCAAINAGRIEDLKRMTVRNRTVEVEVSEPPVQEESVPITVGKIPVLPISDSRPVLSDAPVLKVIREERIPTISEAGLAQPARIPKPDDGLIFEVPVVIAEAVIEEVQIVEEEMILPAEAVMIVSENIDKPQFTGDDGLRISLINDLIFTGGERKTLNIMVGRGNEDFGLSKAHVVIKIIGSAFRPLIFHAKTDSNGVAVVHVQLPNFRSGRAVLLIRAMYDGEEAELRRVISQG